MLLECFARLKQACEDPWQAYCEHDFVNQLGEGTLALECFRHYLLQDYLFLLQFARAHALLVYKSDNLPDMMGAADALHAILRYEMDLHVQFSERWGLSAEDMTAVEEHPANMAYTRYVLERGFAGDALELQVAMLPCTVGYSEIGVRLKDQYAHKLASNPYKSWIEMYSDEAYLETAAAAIAHLDRLALAAGEARFDSLCNTFRQATLLEIGFWDMGLDPPNERP